MRLESENKSTEEIYALFVSPNDTSKIISTLENETAYHPRLVELFNNYTQKATENPTYRIFNNIKLNGKIAWHEAYLIFKALERIVGKESLVRNYSLFFNTTGSLTDFLDDISNLNHRSGMTAVILEYGDDQILEKIANKLFQGNNPLLIALAQYNKHDNQGRGYKVLIQRFQNNGKLKQKLFNAFVSSNALPTVLAQQNPENILMTIKFLDEIYREKNNTTTEVKEDQQHILEQLLAKVSVHVSLLVPNLVLLLQRNYFDHIAILRIISQKIGASALNQLLQKALEFFIASQRDRILKFLQTSNLGNIDLSGLNHIHPRLALYITLLYSQDGGGDIIFFINLLKENTDLITTSFQNTNEQNVIVSKMDQYIQQQILDRIIRYSNPNRYFDRLKTINVLDIIKYLGKNIIPIFRAFPVTDVPDHFLISWLLNDQLDRTAILTALKEIDEEFFNRLRKDVVVLMTRYPSIIFNRHCDEEALAMIHPLLPLHKQLGMSETEAFFNFFAASFSTFLECLEHPLSPEFNGLTIYLTRVIKEKIKTISADEFAVILVTQIEKLIIFIRKTYRATPESESFENYLKSFIPRLPHVLIYCFFHRKHEMLRISQILSEHLGSDLYLKQLTQIILYFTTQTKEEILNFLNLGNISSDDVSALSIADPLLPLYAKLKIQRIESIEELLEIITAQLPSIKKRKQEGDTLASNIFDLIIDKCVAYCRYHLNGSDITLLIKTLGDDLVPVLTKDEATSGIPFIDWMFRENVEHREILDIMKQQLGNKAYHQYINKLILYFIKTELEYTRLSTATLKALNLIDPLLPLYIKFKSSNCKLEAQEYLDLLHSGAFDISKRNLAQGDVQMIMIRQLIEKMPSEIGLPLKVAVERASQAHENFAKAQAYRYGYHQDGTQHDLANQHYELAFRPKTDEKAAQSEERLVIAGVMLAQTYLLEKYGKNHDFSRAAKELYEAYQLADSKLKTALHKEMSLRHLQTHAEQILTPRPSPQQVTKLTAYKLKQDSQIQELQTKINTLTQKNIKPDSAASKVTKSVNPNNNQAEIAGLQQKINKIQNDPQYIQAKAIEDLSTAQIELPRAIQQKEQDQFQYTLLRGICREQLASITTAAYDAARPEIATVEIKRTDETTKLADFYYLQCLQNESIAEDGTIIWETFNKAKALQAELNFSQYLPEQQTQQQNYCSKLGLALIHTIKQDAQQTQKCIDEAREQFKRGDAFACLLVMQENCFKNDGTINFTLFQEVLALQDGLLTAMGLGSFDLEKSQAEEKNYRDEVARLSEVNKTQPISDHDKNYQAAVKKWQEIGNLNQQQKQQNHYHVRLGIALIDTMMKEMDGEMHASYINAAAEQFKRSRAADGFEIVLNKYLLKGGIDENFYRKTREIWNLLTNGQFECSKTDQKKLKPILYRIGTALLNAKSGAPYYNQALQIFKQSALFESLAYLQKKCIAEITSFHLDMDLLRITDELELSGQIVIPDNQKQDQVNWHVRIGDFLLKELETSNFYPETATKLEAIAIRYLSYDLSRSTVRMILQRSRKFSAKPSQFQMSFLKIAAGLQEKLNSSTNHSEQKKEDSQDLELRRLQYQIGVDLFIVDETQGRKVPEYRTLAIQLLMYARLPQCASFLREKCIVNKDTLDLELYKHYKILEQQLEKKVTLVAEQHGQLGYLLIKQFQTNLNLEDKKYCLANAIEHFKQSNLLNRLLEVHSICCTMQQLITRDVVEIIKELQSFLTQQRQDSKFEPLHQRMHDGFGNALIAIVDQPDLKPEDALYFLTQGIEQFAKHVSFDNCNQLFSTQQKALKFLQATKNLVFLEIIVKSQDIIVSQYSAHQFSRFEAINHEAVQILVQAMRASTNQSEQNSFFMAALDQIARSPSPEKLLHLFFNPDGTVDLMTLTFFMNSLTAIEERITDTKKLVKIYFGLAMAVANHISPTNWPAIQDIKNYFRSALILMREVLNLDPKMAEDGYKCLYGKLIPNNLIVPTLLATAKELISELNDQENHIKVIWTEQLRIASLNSAAKNLSDEELGTSFVNNAYEQCQQPGTAYEHDIKDEAENDMKSDDTSKPETALHFIETQDLSVFTSSSSATSAASSRRLSTSGQSMVLRSTSSSRSTELATLSSANSTSSTTASNSSSVVSPSSYFKMSSGSKSTVENGTLPSNAAPKLQFSSEEDL